MKKLYSLAFVCLFGVLQAGTKPKEGFIENKGQIHDQNFKPNTAVKYLLSIAGMNIQLKQNSFSYDTYTVEQKNTETTRETALTKLKRPTLENIYHFHRVDVEFIGANAQPEIIAEQPSETYFNYYTTGTTEQGATNVRSFGKVTYKNIYPNVDLEFIAKEGKMKYNFILHYGADMNVIKWKYQGANASEIKNSNISIFVKQGEFNETIPESYIASNSQKAKQVKIDFIKYESGVYGFASNQKLTITPNQDLVIDPNPIVLWSTYFGKVSYDSYWSACNDVSPNFFVIGTTSSTSGIATIGAYQNIYGGGTSDAVFSKYDKSGNLIWSTYYGGAGVDEGTGIFHDGLRYVYVSGTTSSPSSMSTILAHQPTYGGGAHDAFIAKFDTNGVRQWSSYYGGTADEYNDFGNCIGDTLGNIYLCGVTSSTNSIVTGGTYQFSYGGGPYDAYLVKFNTMGNRIWGTYYGGSGDDKSYSCTTDLSGNIYMTGITTSTNSIATIGAHQIGFSGSGNTDAYIAKFNKNGILKWGSYYGASSGNDRGLFIKFDKYTNDLFFGGDTESTDSIASIGSHQVTYGGSLDGYIVNFDTNGVRKWATYYGGTGFDYFLSFNSDTSFIYLGGATASFSNIATSNALQLSYSGGPYGDIVLVKLNKYGVRQWGTYFGGQFWEAIFSIILDANTDIYAIGSTSSNNYPTTAGSNQPLYGGGSSDGFCAKFRQSVISGIEPFYLENISVSIFPNPNSGSFTLQTKEDVVLEIVNELGQIVKTIKLDGSNNHQTTISGLADGVYCLKDKLSGNVIKNKIVVVR